MIAEFHGGKCLSKEYINCEIPMLWECNRTINGIVHFDLSKIAIHDVKNKGCWCHEYMNLGLEFAQNLTNKRVGSIQRGTWCPYCVGKPGNLDIEYAKELARSRNGECLSNVYINYTTHLRWRCSKTHEWLASINAKSIAYSRAEEYLTDSYINCNSQLLWRCNKNHHWYSTLSRVKNDNTWCPYCSKYKHERLCQEIVSKYLGPPFEIRRPDFLKFRSPNWIRT
ncbi:hypothetical protein F8M41_005727 [Gigaspora margarita]|uniref:Zinc-ribbon domain-containing protein n=1 Tax=Gigaspora margarita TaxID=4874 RepID=A0A8H4A5N8_GIGMA|nr:hypothetical protein F8M41_005727 [Gigaspora margarita]